MKSKISYSRFATILTVIVLGLLFIGCIVTIHEKPAFFMLLVIYLILLVSSLFYGASYIKADNNNIIMGSILKCRKISMQNLESIELFQPTMGAIRIFASGGFMGYWGIFRESDIGRYYAFYGKASDCFLVRMKNGDKYVLGCDNPDKMVDYINSHIVK
ncbi:hypothetical protein E4T81_11180 [Barnesiella sp. WM24]|uniref:PH domain-containing protein n=1 Tax=Barnesiella sp. WM24 TaxID=2558278 RepID=UPI001071C83B|nr:PH domain-containing protein [Barnesiella sp. WM24]TFU92690.1 hypothetical protein E4T81_11180 [Barnesiella sp. WM24]